MLQNTKNNNSLIISEKQISYFRKFQSTLTIINYKKLADQLE